MAVALVASVFLFNNARRTLGDRSSSIHSDYDSFSLCCSLGVTVRPSCPPAQCLAKAPPLPRPTRKRNIVSLLVLFSFLLLVYGYRLDAVDYRLLGLLLPSLLLFSLSFSCPSFPLPLPSPPLYSAYSPVESDTFFDLFLTAAAFFILDPGNRVLRLASTFPSGRRHYCT